VRTRIAVALVSSVVGILLAYLAYCWRSFYTIPDLVINGETGHKRDLIVKWYSDSDYNRPQNFDLKDGIYYLCHPFEKRKSVYLVVDYRTGPWSVIVMRPEKAYGDRIDLEETRR
jgi:hypothetical protein